MAHPKILITGGAGFVGSPTVRDLLEEFQDALIGVLDLEFANLPEPIKSNPRVELIRADITIPASIDNAIASFHPTIVIHTAGIVPSLAERHHRRLEAVVYKINVEGTRNVVQACIKHQVSSLVYTSSCCAVIDDVRYSYENIDETWPTSRKSFIYGESKALAEEIVLQANCESFSTCVLRPSVLCGPGDKSLVPPIHACIAKLETPFVIGDGRNLWDVTYVDNIAYAHVLAAKNLLTTKTAAGEAFFIQNNEPITFRDFCLAVWAHFGHIPPFEIHIPLFLAWFAGLVAEIFTWLTGTPTTLSRGSVQDATSMRYASGWKAKQILGYEARVGLADGIARSCKDYALRLETSDSTTKRAAAKISP